MLIGAMLVRNEASRWLETVLKQMELVCDKIIILDDCSTDETPDICKKYGDVYYSDRSYWGINELKQRKFLWELTTHEAKIGDWILCLDADETIPGIERIKVFIEQADMRNCDGISFRLYDMWNETEYRDDSLWNAHLRDWVMCVKYTPKEYKWRESKLHCGRFPENAVTLCGNTELPLQHWGWSREEERKEKFERYMKADPKGKNGNLKQYLSIMDESPNLRRF